MLAAAATGEKTQISQVVFFEQPCKLLTDQIPKHFFDPNSMCALKSFCINPNEEILLVIYSAGYNFDDNLIYGLFARGGGDKNSFLTSSHQICYWIKNISRDCTLHVGTKCNLNLLLEMPNIYSKLCYSYFDDFDTFQETLTAIEKKCTEKSKPCAIIAQNNSIVITSQVATN